MKKKFLTKKVAAIGAAIGITLGGAGAAFAFFTTTASTPAAVTVGTAQLSVNWDLTNGTPLFPGSGSQFVHYTVTNTSTGNVQLNSVNVTVNHNGLNEIIDYVSGNPVPGCNYLWFGVSDHGNLSLAQTLAGSGTFTDYSTVTLNESGGNQNACQTHTPQVTITAS